MSYLKDLSYQKWLSDTSVFAAFRGDNLKKLDKAVETYCANRNLSSHCLDCTDNLKKTFEDWVRHKMQQANQGAWRPSMFLDDRKNKIWKEDRRNHSGAMTQLFESLYVPAELQRELDVRLARITQEEKEAIEYMKDCTEKLAAKLFAGKTMQFRLLAKKAKVVVSTAEEYMTEDEKRMKRLMDRLARDSVAAKARKMTARASDFRTANEGRFAAAQELAGTVSDSLDTFSNGASTEFFDSVSDATAGAVKEATVGRVTEWLKDAISEIIGVNEGPDVAETIISAIGLESIAAFAETLTPLLGSIKATAAGAQQIAQGIEQAYKAKEFSESGWYKGETATAAVASVADMLSSAAKENTMHGARHAAVGVGRIVADCFPGGQAASMGLSIADTIVDVLFMVKSYYEDYKHIREMNIFLASVQSPDTAPASNTSLFTGKEMFEKSPLLGAYWIMIAETSSVIGICVEELSANTFMSDVEMIVKTQLNDLRGAAADLIASSNIVIPELSAHRLINEAKTPTPHSTRERRIVDGITDTFRSWTIYKRVEKKFPQPDWKNRIVGVSSDEYFAQNPTTSATLPVPASRH